MDETAIRINDLYKSYRIIDDTVAKHYLLKKFKDYPVISGLNLEIQKGEVVGIVGRNGCGKSTLLKLISKILKPTGGTIEVNGKVASILEMSMGFHNDMTGVENIYLRSGMYHIPREQMEMKINEVIKYADLDEFINNPVRTYSSGMRSRLAFSIMVNVEADIYLVDEALSTGDAAFAMKASEHLKDLVRKGKTVLLTSHNIGSIESTCSRAIWLDKGNVFMDGDANIVCAEYNKSIMESFEITKELAENGSSSAMYRLATFYRDGVYTDKDNEEYLKWLKEAAHKQHIIAMAEYADTLMESNDESALSEAKTLYAGAADNGNYDARRKYSAIITGEYNEYAEIEDILKKDAEINGHISKYTYGAFLYTIALRRSDYAKAFTILSEAEAEGNLDAKYRTALMYRDGVGIERSIETSISKLEELASIGHPKAMVALAEMYAQGKYVQIDLVKSFKWYLESAYVGNAKSQYQVAMMYRDGSGTEMNEKEAMKWFRCYAESMITDYILDAAEAAKRIDGPATDSISLLTRAADCYNIKAAHSLAIRYSHGINADPEKAFTYSIRASKLIGKNTSDAASCYKDGIGTETNHKEAIYFYKIAADTGDAKAMYELAMLYKNDDTIADNMNLYRKYLRMAAANGNKDASRIVAEWDKRNKKRKGSQK